MFCHDADNPDTPRTAFGAVVADLKHRRAAGHGPFTGQSCDNLQGNGATLRRTVASLARLSDPGLAEWIDARCSFPNSMVDCIVPATGGKEVALAAEMGIQDAAPVTYENFRQWVIEDDFCAGRPDWDRVGATFSDRIHDYQTMKIRILNGGHQVIANVAEVLAIDTVADIMADDRLRAMFRKVEDQEIAPFVQAVPGRTPQAYVDLIEARFANPAIRTPRGASPLKAPPGIRALCCPCCATVSRGGGMSPGMSEIYGDLGGDARFVTAFTDGLTLIQAQGMRSAVAQYLNT